MQYESVKYYFDNIHRIGKLVSKLKLFAVWREMLGHIWLK